MFMEKQISYVALADLARIQGSIEIKWGSVLNEILWKQAIVKTL